MKRIILLFGVAWMLTLSAYAQEKIVTGKVTSTEDGSALPGVNILVKGTTQGTVSDASGNYSIAVPEGASLVFTFIGYTLSEVGVGTRTTVDVQMAPDTQQLSEVVVVGYGTQLKQELTGNIAKVSGKEIENLPVPSFDQAIQGRAAGVFVEAGNGKLGQGMKVRVRGSASVSASNEPLYVIDGVIATADDLSGTDAPTNPLAQLNTNDIESIDILKDASASAIYGSRAANGVVLITTKRGKSGKTRFNIGYQKGFSKPTRSADWLDGSQYYTAFKEAFDNANAKSLAEDGMDFGAYWYDEPGLTFDQLLDYELGNWSPTANENWAENAYQDDAGLDQFDLTASGGNEKTKFYVSLQHLNQNGILINDQLERTSARINLDNTASEKFNFGFNFSLSRTVNNRLSDDNEFTTPMQMLALPPIQQARLSDGTLNASTVYFNGLIKAENSSFETTVFRNVSNIYGQLNLTKNLSFRSEAALDILTQNEERWDGAAVDSETGNKNGGGVSRWVNVQNYSTNNFLSFKKDITASQYLDVTAGMSYQYVIRNSTSSSAQTFPSDAFKTLVNTSVITAAPTNETSYAFLSYFARANYKLMNKYLLSLSGRIDGSSKFGADERYGFFPAVSAGWIVSEESFLSNVESISFLKFRASYGVTGNAPDENFAGLGLYSGFTYDQLGGVAPTQLSNPGLKWETTVQTDIGFDYGLFNDRITGEIDYYIKNTDDLLLNSNVSGISGYKTQYLNIGSLQNKGFEFVINTRNLTGELAWTTSLNFARNINKITNLDNNIIEAGYISRAVEGESIGVFYTREFAGANPGNGDAIWFLNRPLEAEDQENVDDGYIFQIDKYGDRYVTSDYDLAERKVVGNPNPDFVGGINNTLSYKGFDFSFLFQFVVGNDSYNAAGRFERADFVFWDNQLVKDWKDAWDEPGDNTDVPEARLFYGNGDYESSRYIQDASYVRLKTLSLGYNVPASFISKYYLSSLRLYISGQNLLTFTKYDLNDPEVNTDFIAGNVSQGTDFYAAPQAKTIMFGINIGF